MAKIIEILPTFKYAINIRDDYANPEKLNSFIPTYTNVNLLANYLTSINSKSNKAFLLSGAYGTGKSFLISILIAFLNGKVDERSIMPLLNKIDEFSEYKQNITDYINKTKYAVVFANDIFGEFKQSLLVGMQESIKRYNLNINLNSSYDSILEKIQRWELNHKEFFKSLCLELKKKNWNISKLKKQLDKYDKKAYNVFEKVYPKVMGGESFIPFNSLNSIEKIMGEFEENVKCNGFKGVIYIFDEFGRYLESNINKIDVKEVQDAAEYCSSDKDSVLFLITHKDLFQYSRKLQNIDFQNEWEKVSGRFNKTHLIYEETNSLKLIKTVLRKKNTFKKFINDNFNKINKQIELLEYIGVTNAEDIFKDLYPLNYTTALMLPKLSQKLAQNERSLFSFLCGNEKNALPSIFANNKSSFELIAPDILFDYFEENFKFLGVNSKEYNIYLNAKNILSSIKDNDTLSKKIIKIIALFHIVNEFKVLTPSKYFIKTSLGLDADKFDTITERLIKDEKIAYRKHYDFFVLAQDIDFNIDLEVQKHVQKLEKIDYVEVLNKHLPLGFEYPLFYNNEYKITRYFKKCYIDLSNISMLDKVLKDNVQDGVVAYILNFNDSTNKLTSAVVEQYNNVIFIEPKHNVEICGYLKELEAIECLEATNKQIKKSEVAKNELFHYKSDLIKHLEELLKNNLTVGENVRIAIHGKFLRKIKSLKDYNEKLKNYLEKNTLYMNKVL
ncbi:hypothetical protein AAEX28_07910 [Lentisphaerota bacterium WC36G]|nr:hypothetical protein LJT99_10765 [Lentisphaerae bacterium WC36]